MKKCLTLLIIKPKSYYGSSSTHWVYCYQKKKKKNKNGVTRWIWSHVRGSPALGMLGQELMTRLKYIVKLSEKERRMCVHACTREHTHKVFLKIWKNSSLNSLLMECKMANQAQALGRVGMTVQKCTHWDSRKMIHSSTEKQSLGPALRVSPKLSTHRPEPFQCLRISMNGM